MAAPPDKDSQASLPPPLRILQGLVIGLTASLIFGVITVVAVVVTRFPKAATPPLPETLVLPQGASALAVTQGADWIGITTTDDRILIYDRASGNLRQTVTLTRP
ncbi:DUF6476 family protein [Falsigemmobacter faecalis]|uniref:Uncharacterized protein n=1 Tax=Falsigemmobacter faecalis TaxID=2488730 RepID=A0A3P3D5E7_9RHOB|nr:DUF6476 family protein [Falsigemmobacter faecalis]RRH69371.1 hypothetical protein EG244_18415 [Falsigemmobacter faecalis]